jgi:hypothetical protein
MGIIRLGPPADFISQIAERYGIKNFVETGTYYGKTALWAATIFEQVITVEFSEEIHQSNLETYQEHKGICFLFGDSRKHLKEIVPSLTSSAIFWLDSHWSGGETYGEDDQCPLLDELVTINLSPVSHFILIDDARLFTSPPPLPNRIEQWPTIQEVIETLGSNGKQYYVVISEDVLIAVPLLAKDFVAEYCQKLNTEMWQRDSKQLIKTWLEYGASAKSAKQNHDEASQTADNALKHYLKKVAAKIFSR